MRWGGHLSAMALRGRSGSIACGSLFVVGLLRLRNATFWFLESTQIRTDFI